MQFVCYFLTVVKSRQFQLSLVQMKPRMGICSTNEAIFWGGERFWGGQGRRFSERAVFGADSDEINIKAELRASLQMPATSTQIDQAKFAQFDWSQSLSV